MKATKFLSIIIVVLLCCGGSSCKDKHSEEKYPILLGKQTCVGKIVCGGNPCPPSDIPCIPGIVLWLETTLDSYVIVFNSSWVWGMEIIFDGNAYLEGDEVEITGEVIVFQNQFYEEYFSIEIETIKKVTK